MIETLPGTAVTARPPTATSSRSYAKRRPSQVVISRSVWLDVGQTRDVQPCAVIARDAGEVEAVGDAEAERLGDGERPVGELGRVSHQLELGRLGRQRSQRDQRLETSDAAPDDRHLAFSSFVHTNRLNPTATGGIRRNGAAGSQCLAAVARMPR